MNTLQAEQIRDLITAICEKGGVQDVYVEDFTTMENGTIVLKISQYVHFFPQGIDQVQDNPKEQTNGEKTN